MNIRPDPVYNYTTDFLICHPYAVFVYYVTLISDFWDINKSALGRTQIII